MQANGLRTDRIQAGQVLRIPRRRPPGAAQPFVPAAAPSSADSPEVGSAVVATRPLRLRRGPKTYHTTVAIAAQGTVLRILEADGAWFHVTLPDETAGWVAGNELRGPAEAGVPSPGTSDGSAARGADLAREAMRYLGVPYVWGGESPRGVDCSGFVYVVFSARLPAMARLRSYDYFQMGVPVGRGDLQAGDLVFFSTYAPGPSHVGIYAGSGRFLHASSGARRVLATPLDDPYYTARYLGARRLVAP
jgi:cell wall-associated NlpC family hydrolase